MKILLCAVNARYVHSNPAVYALRTASGSGSVKIREFTINQDPEEILGEIAGEEPDVLCFSVYIWNLGIICRIAGNFHILHPDVPVWAGGPEVSFEAEEFLLRHGWLKGIMTGEGEDTFRELCAHYEKGEKALSGIAGLTYALTGPDGERKTVTTAKRQPADFGDLPFPYEEEDDFENRIMYYESMRGCPFSCSYCLSSVDRQMRFRPLEKVYEELSFFIKRRALQVKFVDRTFNCDRDRALAVWKFISEHDNGFTGFHFEIAADLLRDEDMSFLSSLRPGLIRLEIGVQSTNERTLEAIHRKTSVKKVENAVRRIKSSGNIVQHLDLIAGLPFEDMESFHRSFNEVYAWKPDQLQLGFLKVLKGTEMHLMAGKYGIRYRPYPPYEVLMTQWLPYEDVRKLKLAEEMLEIYYNSGQFPVTVRLLEELCGDAFEAFLKLGTYYRDKGLLGKPFSRDKRCSVLLGFAEKELEGSKDAEETLERLREAATFDLYSRENCNTRPAWAPDPGTFRDVTRMYCKRGSLSHVEPFHYRFPVSFENETCMPKREDGVMYAYFDYEKRDPVTRRAKTEYLK